MTDDAILADTFASDGVVLTFREPVAVLFNERGAAIPELGVRVPRAPATCPKRRTEREYMGLLAFCLVSDWQAGPVKWVGMLDSVSGS